MNQTKDFFTVLNRDRSLMAMFWAMVLVGILLLGTLITATFFFIA